MNETVSIIGAGIGGLTTAVALRQKGMKVIVYEGAEAIRPVGAGILLANNAMQVYKRLGIHEKIQNAGNRISLLKITNAQLRVLSIARLEPYEKKYGVYNTAIHRASLQKILAEECGYENIVLGKRLKNIEVNKDYKLYFDDDTSASCNILIGADGIKSVVRNCLFPESRLRYSHQKCWRGVCEFNPDFASQNEGLEAWGKGKRFGYVRINEQQLYWYAVVNSNDEVKDKSDLKTTFNDFHPDLREILKSTKEQNIICDELYDLQHISCWHKNNVCLMGDAAHATTPNLGQGACQAIEDANVLGQLAENGKFKENAFVRFEQLRMSKAHYIVNTSWNLGKLAQ